jgi:lysozyme
MKIPDLTREQVQDVIKPFNLPDKIIVLGIRGFNKEMGEDPAKNERNIYDDAIFVFTPDRFRAYNANTDPSVARKGVAVLKAGAIYWYKKGLHGISGTHPYLALRQASNVTVIRDGGQEETDTPENRFWIDIHRGGYTTTSSLGCQTIHPDQWDNFRDVIFAEMDRHHQGLVPYILIEK